MPTEKPRLNVVLEPPLYLKVKNLAKKEGTSLSLKARDLIRESLEVYEEKTLHRKGKKLSQIKETLGRHKKILEERFKVKKIGIFGSWIKDGHRKRSDVDILVEFSGPVGWGFVDLKDYLQKILKTKVDLATPDALKTRMKDTVLKEVVFV